MERHEAVVAGAGPAGLAAAAVLRKHGFEVMVLERAGALGARWRDRYDGLRLNTMRIFSSLPGYRMERRYGRYPARDDFVAYLERYAQRQGLDVRYETALERVDRDQDGGWSLQTSSGPLLARHAVVATGYDAVPKLPNWPGRDGFAGELIHAAEYRSPEPYRGRKVLIVGAGNTGVDIAGHLVTGGADVSVAMRTPPNVFPRDWLGFPLALSTVPLEKLPSPIGDSMGRMTQRMIFGDLSTYGVPRAPEGFMSRFRRTLQGPAVDDGFVAALKAGRTRIVPTVARFEGPEVELIDGTRLTPDAVICATGYGRGLEPIVGHLGVLRDDGLPEAHDGAAHPAAPGLYFAGFFGLPSGQIKIFRAHARRIARAAARDREASG